MMNRLTFEVLATSLKLNPEFQVQSHKSTSTTFRKLVTAWKKFKHSSATVKKIITSAEIVPQRLQFHFNQ